MPLVVERYDPSCNVVWDQFVLASRNGTFLLLRGYMDYHRERFDDHSLIVRSASGELVATCPANISNDLLVSHAGLTYGGFLVDNSMKMPLMLEVFDATLTHLQKMGIRRFVYKTIPHIYHRCPSEEDRYALFLCNAQILRRAVLTAVDRRCRLPLQERRARGVRRAHQTGLAVSETSDFATYWDILSARLLEAFGVHPVHTLAEIELLHERFPDHIRLFACYQESKMLAGVVLYESERVAHVQYVAANARGREVGALDLLFSTLLTGAYAEKPYFDFGTADECHGRSLNRGLIDQKEGFGARTVVHDHYELRVDEFRPGQLTAAMEWR